MEQALRAGKLINSEYLEKIMYTFWAFVKTVTGGFMVVTVQANTNYEATQMLRAQYGELLLSEAARRP